jgi:hypothetical protein
MKRQIEMEETMLRAHREFVKNLEKSLEILDREIGDAAEMTQICTDEWCLSTEMAVDEIAKIIYSMSEPRWLTVDDSKGISKLRKRVHDIYANYKQVRPA